LVLPTETERRVKRRAVKRLPRPPTKSSKLNEKDSPDDRLFYKRRFGKGKTTIQ